MRLFLRQVSAKAILVLLTAVASAQPPEVPLAQRSEALLKRMQEEKLSAKEAWQDGALTKELLLYALGAGNLLDNKRDLWQPGPQSYEWTQLLVIEFPEMLDNPEALDQTLQVRIAFLLMSKSDARGAEIMEQILANMSREKPDMRIVGSVIYNLASYYRQKGEPAKAIETSLRIQEFSDKPSTVSNHILSAARATYATGDKEGAMQLYEEVVNYGYGWATGHAYADVAGHLFREGKVEEARALLKKPIEGANADQARVFLSHRLAQSYYQKGEWEEARRYAKATVDQYNSLANPIKNHGLEWIVDSAKQLPEQIKQWEKKPVRISPEAITLKAPADPTEPISTYFNLHSYRSITAKAVANNPDIEVWPLQSPHQYQSRNSAMFGVKLKPGALQKDLTAEIVVTIEELPDASFRIPITLQKEGPTQ